MAGRIWFNKQHKNEDDDKDNKDEKKNKLGAQGTSFMFVYVPLLYETKLSSAAHDG